MEARTARSVHIGEILRTGREKIRLIEEREGPSTRRWAKLEDFLLTTAAALPFVALTYSLGVTPLLDNLKFMTDGLNQILPTKSLWQP